MVVGDHELCPACANVVRGDAWCARCGLELAGTDAAELRRLAADLATAEAELQVTWTRRNDLSHQLSMRQLAFTSRAAPAKQERVRVPRQPSPARPPGEWNVDGIRNFLLWTGAALLALSALAFTAVAWTHLGPTGRASLLFGVTIVAAIGASALRTKLPATSGALTGLAIALSLVDWLIVRRAGVGDGLALTTFWMLGTAVVSLVALLLGRVAARVPAHRAFALLAPTSAVLGISVGVDAAWSAAILLALLSASLAALVTFARDHIADPVIRSIVRTESIVTWIAAALFAIAAAFMADSVAASINPAVAVLMLGLAPGVVLVRPSARGGDRTLMAEAVLASLGGAVLTLASNTVGPIGLLTIATVLGCIAIAATPHLAREWKGAAQFVGWLAASCGLAFAGLQAAVALLGPLEWFGHAWTATTSVSARAIVAGPDTSSIDVVGWCAVGILWAVAAATAYAWRPAADAPPAPTLALWPFVPFGLVLGAVVLVPIAAGSSAAIACAVATGVLVAVLVGSALAVRDRPDRALPYGILAIIPAVPAAGWAALTPATSITVLAVSAVGAFSAAVLGREPLLRAAHAVLGATAVATLAAVVVLASDGSVGAAGFAATVAAGLFMIVGAQLRKDTPDGIALELAGVFGIAVGAAIASPSPLWLAGSLTAAVPLLLAARVRGHRTIIYGIGAALAALGATWAWLAAADVTVVEAYTLPAAVVALGLGTLARREGPAHSWLGVGPAIVLVLGPTLALALGQSDDTRALLAGALALLILVAGAWQRLQAPIVLGGVALLVLAVDKLGPTAVQLPRWLLLAFAGSVLLWIGTTFERRRDDALRAARRFEQLG